MAFGLSPFGISGFGSGLGPGDPFTVDSGYGGDSYGVDSYGSVDTIAPIATTAVCQTGFRVELFFSEPMSLADANLLATTSYAIEPIFGGATVTVQSVSVATVSAVDVYAGITSSGALSVYVDHSGTTLGGVYRIRVVQGIKDISGNPMVIPPLVVENPADPFNVIYHQSNKVVLLALGEPPSYIATALSGNTVLLDFAQDMLHAGITTLTNFTFTSTPAYPVDLEAVTVTHPYLGDASRVLLSVKGMTALNYACEVTQAEAFDYDGTYLPSAATTFIGTTIGTGSTSVGGGYITLSKLLANAYGWQFGDSTGKVTNTSTYRMDIEFNPAGMQIFPLLQNGLPFAEILADDGTDAVGAIRLTRVAGADAISITGLGTYAVTWSTGGAKTLSIVRNQQASTYTFLMNGVPFVTTAIASFIGGGSFSGISLTLLAGYELAGFKLLFATVTASDTVWSSAWNFLHGSLSTLAGSGLLARDALLTEHGPLTKDWGDPTPATKNDVTVRVNGVAVEVRAVNPYIGKIETIIPIPLMVPGAITVTVDYKWMLNPIFAMGGYNTIGSVFNQWSFPGGHTYPPAHGEQIQDLTHPKGCPDQMPFPMRLVMGPVDRPEPLLIGHRFMALDRAYTAAMNNPTLLLFNQNPHSVAVPGFETIPNPTSVSFDGLTLPTDANSPWTLLGEDLGHVDVGAGTYTVIDTESGSYGVGTAAVWYREVDLTFPSATVVAGRFKVNSYVPHGVFTGVGFGIHDNRRIFLMGCLVLNGVQHVGLLKDATKPQEFASWEVGPKVAIEILSTTSFKALTANLPTGLSAGDRFQIIVGSQTGVYTLASVTVQSDGYSTVTISGAFPADPNWWGNRYFDTYFEVVFSEPLTYRITANPKLGTCTLYVSGDISGTFLSLTKATPYPDPAQTDLMLLADGDGQAFWGSLSTWATNNSTWSFFRYGVQPDQRAIHGRGLVVASEMSDIPREDPNSEWFRTQGFGYDEIEGPTNRLLLKHTAESTQQDFSYGYARIEPFIQPGINVDVDTTFQVDSGTLGSGDLQVIVQNTNRQVLLGTLLYREAFGVLPRRLVDAPSVSASCLYVPTDDPTRAWELNPTLWLATTAVPTARVDIKTLTLSSVGGYRGTIDLTGVTPPIPKSRVLEARFKTDTTFSANAYTGIYLSGSAGDGFDNKLVNLTLRKVGATAVVSFTNVISSGPTLQDYTFNWADGGFHTYRVLIDWEASNVLLYIDDVLYPPTGLALFDAYSVHNDVAFGCESDSVTTLWDYVHYHMAPPLDAKRTIGVWLGGSLSDIDSWQIPRTDVTDELNSSPSAIIEEMDWRSQMDVRIHWDAGWGVSVFRPDLPLPPFFTGDFATDITEPSAAWIRVETQWIPRVTTAQTFGSVSFGSLDPKSLSQQRWKEVRYRIYNWKDTDYRSAEHMVFNQYSVITSAEQTRDVTPENVVITSLDNKHVTLTPTRINASRVFSVIDNGQLISSTFWTFDPTLQLISLVPDSEGNEVSFSGDHVPITVVFAPGNPITMTYLEGQPLLDSSILLNEGTPPYQMHQAGPDVASVQFGTQVNNPLTPLGAPDTIFNNPYRYRDFSADPDALYTDLTFTQVTNGGQTGLIKTPFDEWAEIDLSGALFNEKLNSPKKGFSQASFRLFSGGGFIGGTFGPGTSIFYPTLGADKAQVLGEGGLNLELQWKMSMTSVLTDAIGLVSQDLTEVDILNVYADEFPPTKHVGDPLPSPNGTPTIGGVPVVPPAHGHGNVYATFEVGGDYSRFGPWGGMNSLIPGPQEIIGPEIGGVPVGLPFTHGSCFYGASTAQPTGVPVSGSGRTFVGGSALPAAGRYSWNLGSAN